MDRRIYRRLTAVGSLALLAGCSLGHTLFGTGPQTTLGQPAATASVFGYAVTDEPEATLVARQILNAGGNAADAATAAGFALAVTLPSRAGLGGGGACILRMPDSHGNLGPATVLSFPPGAPDSAGGTRPAAVPTAARGLLALEARYGTLPISSVIVPAERLAAGVPVSPALESDLQVVGPALLGDPNAAAIFGQGGAVLPAGANLVQPDLASTLEVLRTQGVQGFYQGGFAGQFATAADQAGGGLTVADMNAALPQYLAPDIAQAKNAEIAAIPTTAAPDSALPASAGFAALDKNGGVVACAVTMNNLFGTGRMAAGTGILLAASPRTGPVPLLAAAIAYKPGGGFLAAATGTGQQGAAQAAAQGIANALANQPAAPVAEPGRANIISCPGGVPGAEATCTASADPRGQGLAIGGR